MSLKHVEIESLGKSFLLFFTSMTLLMSMVLYLSYSKERTALDERLFTQMRLCSFDLKCDQFEFDFVTAEQDDLYRFHKNEEGVFGLFTIANTSDYVLKLFYSSQKYQNELDRIQEEHFHRYLLALVLLALLSFLFSWYALRPLRQALILSDEFIKDILHDFNTPLSSLRLNSSLLKKELGENTKITRIEQAVQTILSLQDNLRSYSDESPLQNDLIDLEALIQKRSAIFAENYPHLRFICHLEPLQIYANADAMTRILDNLISNAAKYNKKEGTIEITLSAADRRVLIKDSGKGIKEPKKIFRRFYKEHERGLGIGLHIVKKLCDSLRIPITVESQVGVGSSFSLDLRHLCS
jgi:signal transduction histidine kinase